MKKVFIVLVSFLCTKLFSQDTSGRIDEEYIKVVVNIIKPPLPNGFRSDGTGFLVSKAVRDKGSKIYLITNKHMIGNYNFVDPFIIDEYIDVNLYTKNSSGVAKAVRLNLKDKLGKINPIVKLHEDPLVDIAAIDITHFYINDQSLYHAYVDTTYLIPLNRIRQETELSFGSQIFALGYPAGLKLAKTNQPIAKSGYIASALSGNIELQISEVNKVNDTSRIEFNKKFFLVDGLIIGGNSGGPIINPKEIKIRMTKQGLEYSENPIPNLIVGIVSFGFPGTGLSIIYPCDYILDIIRND